ncbi:PREDICTED: uncharacterized protein C1orf106 homolog [Miniopterus natalensis]|uniref:uncharacterized protein C1orf106 homolog n=1 Tax=Miniopterus natalensis TaxID=291302 RepID=UPI0007A6D536|nr:PREDICTED: uncharacterized protein C1orf106 homolog [Miniopterus natalensis]
MESKDEASDTDSGVILQSGPDSPVSPLKEMKELTYAVRKQQRALEERLEACLEELRRLCLREAELTGVLPAEYPLKPGEKAPKVRRRVGAAYKLDEQALHGEDPLSSLEQELALQLQIAEASRRLSREEKLSRQARRQRKHAMLREEEKLRALERCLGEQRRHRSSLPTAGLPLGRDLSASDDSSLSDGLLLEEEEAQVPKPGPGSSPPSLEGLQPAAPETGVLDRAPIQNGPWKETSLDQPYEKPGKTSDPSSESSSPATTPQDGPSPSSPWLLEPASYHVVPTCSIPGPRQGRTSAPTTPDMQGRRGQSQSLRMDSFRAGPRRRPTHYTVTVPSSCWPPSGPPRPPHAPPSCSEDSGSDGSSVAAVTQELQSWHERVRLRSARPHSLDRQGAFRVRSLPPGHTLGPRAQVPTVCVLRRSPEGAPVQVFVPENGEIISQV